MAVLAVFGQKYIPLSTFMGLLPSKRRDLGMDFHVMQTLKSLVVRASGACIARFMTWESGYRSPSSKGMIGHVGDIWVMVPCLDS